MSRRVLIAPDKFKGTLSAHAAAAAIARGWRAARPSDDVDVLPMSDGGDGFGAVLGELLKARKKRTPTIDAAHRPVPGIWWQGKEAAIIDSAGIVGLAMLPSGKFHPFQLDSFGVGKVLLAAAESGAKKCIIGIGGSATNDGGFGLARALGWKFFNAAWDELTEWWQLHELAHVRPQTRKLSCDVTVAVDVGNPLLGAHGCTRIYGPQKGLRAGDFPLAEKCLGRLAAVLEADPKRAGAGAAGGLGFGLMAFASAKMESGFEIFARLAQLDKRIRQAGLVISGEGCIDGQTAMGKGVGQIALRCAKYKIPCIAMAGDVLQPARVGRLFARTHALTEIATREQALKRAEHYLEKLAFKAANLTNLQSSPKLSS